MLQDKQYKPAKQSPTNTVIHNLLNILQHMMDGIIFSAVWVWIIVKYPKQYQLYLKLNWEKRLLPHPVIPRNANDKFFWRKVFDHDPRFPIISDKLAVKDWIQEEKIDVKTAHVLWRGQDAHHIPPELFQENVVIKANHGWSMNIFIRGDNQDREKIVETANAFLEQSHGKETGEWGYFDIPKHLFIEEMLAHGERELIEMKYYTFGEKIGRLIIIYDRYGEPTADVWMPDEYGSLQRSDETPAVTDTIAGRPKPATGDRAEAIAREIGSRFDHMRVDLYTDGHEIWFSELTIYNLGGHMMDYGFDPDASLNTLWDLRKSWFLSTPQQGWQKIYAQALIRRINDEYLAARIQNNAKLPIADKNSIES